MQSDDGAVQNVVMLGERLSDLDGIDVEPTGDDHVLGAIDDVNSAAKIDRPW